MRRAFKIIASILGSTALVASSIVSATATAAPQTPTANTNIQAPAQQSEAPSPWMMLSIMNSTSTRAIALGGANAAAQPANRTTSLDYVAAHPVINGEIVAFGVWFALIVIALTLKGGSVTNRQTPISPT